MNHYTFEEISVGMTESFTVSITEDMMHTFGELSGDKNPMHTDAGYAKNNGCRDRLVYGMLSSSFFSTLVGMYLPGEYCLLLSCNSSFHNPVYIGDTLTVTGKVAQINESTRTIEIKALITNQDNKKVVKGKILVGFTK